MVNESAERKTPDFARLGLRQVDQVLFGLDRQPRLEGLGLAGDSWNELVC